MIHGPIQPLPLNDDCENVAGPAGLGDIKNPILRTAPVFSHSNCPPEVHKSCLCVRFIAEHTKMLEDSTKVIYIFQLMSLYILN